MQIAVDTYRPRTSLQLPLSVTFDSNSWRPIVLPAELEKHAHKDAFRVIRDGILAGQVKPYLSDVIMLLESIPSDRRGECFRKRPERWSREEKIVMPDGTIQTRWVLSMSFAYELPPPGEQLSEALDAALVMGFRFVLAGNRMAAPRLEPEMYKAESDEESYKRFERTGDALEYIENNGWGAARVEELSSKVAQKQPHLQHIPFRTFAHCGDDKLVSKLIAEWADGDAVAAHYGYGHDVFCTFDVGSSSGRRSVLHLAHRTDLEHELGIRIWSPLDLARELRKHGI